MPWVFPLIFLILFELVADVFSKEYALKGNWYFWAAAITGYILANVFWLWSIRTGSGLAREAVILAVGSAVVAVLIGIYFFHEHASRFQVLGMIMGVLSLILIFWE